MLRGLDASLAMTRYVEFLWRHEQRRRAPTDGSRAAVCRSRLTVDQVGNW